MEAVIRAGELVGCTMTINGTARPIVPNCAGSWSDASFTDTPPATADSPRLRFSEGCAVSSKPLEAVWRDVYRAMSDSKRRKR